MTEYVIQDVCEVIVTDVTTGNVTFLGNTTASGISQSISEDKLRAGIGNGVIFLLRTDKEIDINVTTATFKKEMLAMTQGVEIKNDKLFITKHALVEVTTDVASSDPVLDLTKLPVEDHSQTVITALVEARVEDKDGTQDTVTVTTGVASLPIGSTAKVGDKVDVYYQEEVQGSVIKFDADKFSHKYKVELKTIAYDLDTAKVVSDIYIVFDETIPSGEFSLDFSAGEVINPEITFSAVTPRGSKTMGQFIEVVRK